MKRRLWLVVLGLLAAASPHFVRVSFGAELARWQMVWHDEFAQVDGSTPNPAKRAFDLGSCA